MSGCGLGGIDMHVVCRLGLIGCKAGRGGGFAGKRVMLEVLVFVRGRNVARRCSTRLEF